VRARDIVFVLVVSAVWGLNFVAIKWSVAEIPPLTTSALRFAVVLLLLSPFLKIQKGHMKRLISVAFVLGVAHFSLMFWAVSLADGISPIAVAAQLNVPFATLLAIFVLRETVGWKRASGIGLSFAGVALLAFDPTIFSYIGGVITMIVAAFMYALALVLMRQLKDVPAMTVQSWVALAGFVGAGILSLLLETNQITSITSASSTAWSGVVFSIIGASIIGHGGANYLLRKYEVSTVSPYFLTSPIFSFLGAVFLLGETLSPKMIIGGALTIMGIFIVTIRNNARAKHNALGNN
jgi:O-acetylserine/cysteine efflux transporter